jgi:murein DD-endopeptidase MepM/ murein hydrolase activator NlpD
MNPKLILTLWSFRKELKFVVLAFLTILMVPVIGVILLTQVGINIISDKLVESNPVTQSIEIKDPTSWEVVKSIQPQVVWPVHGVITLEFGESSGYQVFHTGIDIANPVGQIGDLINPAMDGKVIYAGEIFWGYGKHVIIDHGDNITTVYAHLDKIYVYNGQKVTITDTIGKEGQTGWATGPHLHFETRIYGIPVNPRVFLGY